MGCCNSKPPSNIDEGPPHHHGNLAPGDHLSAANAADNHPSAYQSVAEAHHLTGSSPVAPEDATGFPAPVGDSTVDIQASAGLRAAPHTIAGRPIAENDDPNNEPSRLLANLVQGPHGGDPPLQVQTSASGPTGQISVVEAQQSVRTTPVVSDDARESPVSKSDPAAALSTDTGLDNAPHTTQEPPVTADDDFNTVLPINAQSDSASAPNNTDIAALRAECPRFRVLVIGKANAGKTTLLQKICNTVEAPVIRNQHGNVVDLKAINPTDDRSTHDIENELTFSSNDGFVFHDSPGFEAGSVKEIHNVHEFVAKRAVANRLKDQLHAIWYCLPTDNSRPLTASEMKFFEQGNGRVPVIAIFTKYDGMVLNEYNKLRNEQNLGREVARKLAPILADDLFLNSEHYIKRLQGAAHPPARHLRLEGMHKPESNCGDLSQQTFEALDNRKLQLLFVSVQQANIELCTKYALKWYILPALAQSKTKFTSLETKATLSQMKTALECYKHLMYNSNVYHDDVSDSHAI